MSKKIRQNKRQLYLQKLRRNNIDEVVVVLILLIILISTYKYIAHGKGYYFEMPWTGGTIDIKNSTISQDIIIDSNAMWGDESYSIYLLNFPTSKTGGKA